MNTGIKRARVRACALLVCLFAAGCATPPQTRQLFAEPPDIPPRVELEQVPFYPQQEFYCGPASLAAIYNYRGVKAVPDEIARLVFVPGLEGSLQAEVVAATRQYDLLPVRLDGRLESLLREIAAGNPVFVLQNLGLDILPRWHYEIVIGYDLAARELILRSGTNRRIARSFETFERTWRRAGNWALAIVPPDEFPTTADSTAFLAAVVDLEAVGRIAAARRAYAAATKRWSGNLLAYAGLGNTAYAQGEFIAAETAYRAALELDPQRADIWNNLAYALAEQGRLPTAMDAIRRALELEPANPNFEDSLIELSNWQ